MRAGRSAKSPSITIEPTGPLTACARGATASHSFSAPHSSGSKCEKPIHASRAGSIRRATASRVASNMRRIPVCIRNGSLVAHQELVELDPELGMEGADAERVRRDLVDTGLHASPTSGS